MINVSDIYPEKLLAKESRALSAQMNIGMLLGIDLLIGSNELGIVENANSGLSKAKQAFSALSPVMKEAFSRFNDTNPTTKVKNIICHPRKINGNDVNYYEPCVIATFQNNIDWKERKRLCFEGANSLAMFVSKLVKSRSEEAVKLVIRHNPIDSPHQPCFIYYTEDNVPPAGCTPYPVENKLGSLSLISLCQKMDSLEDLHLVVDNHELAFESIGNGLKVKDVPSKPGKKSTSLFIKYCFKNKSGWVVQGYDLQCKAKVKKLLTMSLDDALVSSGEMKKLLQTKKLTAMAQLVHYVIEIVYCPIYKSIHTQDTKKTPLSIIELTSIRKARVDEIKRYMGSS